MSFVDFATVNTVAEGRELVFRSIEGVENTRLAGWCDLVLGYSALDLSYVSAYPRAAEVFVVAGSGLTFSGYLTSSPP